MWTSMLTKELRDCALIAVLALLGIVHFVGEGMGLPLLPIARESSFEIPFLNSTREGTILAIAIAAAVLVGLYQTLIESWRQTTLFLLHRPATAGAALLWQVGGGVAVVGDGHRVAALSVCVVGGSAGNACQPVLLEHDGAVVADRARGTGVLPGSVFERPAACELGGFARLATAVGDRRCCRVEIHPGKAAADVRGVRCGGCIVIVVDIGDRAHAGVSVMPLWDGFVIATPGRRQVHSMMNHISR